MTVRQVAVEAYREGTPALVASAGGGLLAGVVLGGMTDELRTVPGLLVLIPALLATRGNVYGSLGARLATALHQGLIDPRLRTGDERLRAAIAAAIANGLLASSIAAVLAFLALVMLARPTAPLPMLVGVALVSGFLSGIVLSVTVVTVGIVGYRHGYNPDTLVGPVVTTAGDVFGLAFLLLAVRVVLVLGGG